MMPMILFTTAQTVKLDLALISEKTRLHCVGADPHRSNVGKEMWRT